MTQNADSGRRDAELMEYGRHLIRRAAKAGRWGYVLSESDIDRGAKAVVSDPGYRCEIGAAAVRWAHLKGDALDAAIVDEALDALAHNESHPQAWCERCQSWSVSPERVCFRCGLLEKSVEVTG